MNFARDDIRVRDAMADFLHARGFDALPSLDKKPLCRFREFWEARAPIGLMAQFPSPSVQVILGRVKGLVVFDLDGPAAIEEWHRWRGKKPPTWVSHSGGGGQHWWYSIPRDYSRPLPKAVLWTDGGEHSAVERLCDKSLVVAPPSIHPSGRRYKFLDARHSPIKLPMPTPCPGWLLDLPDITPKPVPVAVPFARPAPVAVDPSARGRYRAADVTAAIPDVLALVAEWGIKFTGSQHDGWAECHALGRPDEKPSAAVKISTGAYDDKGTGARMGLFDLAAFVGLFPDWKTAVDGLGERFRARRTGDAA